MEENVIQRCNDKNVKNLNVKNVIYVKRIMFGILLHVVVKMENI